MKIRFVILLLLSNYCFAQEVKITNGDNWKYYDLGDVGDSNWAQSSYSDNSWSSGNAELGYGDGDEQTTISYGTNSSNKHITSYFRKNFNLTSQVGLTCQIKVDDGVVVYLNGTEVFRENMGTGTISYSSTALTTNNENSWFSFTIPSSQTLSGSNVIAVEMHQKNSSSSDLSFDFELITIPPPPPPGLYINEIMASNDTTLDDQSGQSNDWIEIYNGYNYSVDLNGYYLTDDLSELDKHQIDSSIILPAGETYLFWASGEPSIASNHLDFGLSAGGESVAISDPNLLTLDSFSFSDQRTDVSYGRLTDGSTDFRYSTTPTPGNSNLATNTYLGIIDEVPDFNISGGFYSTNQSVQLSTSDPSLQLVYTLDGSDPDLATLSPQSFTYRNDWPGSALTETVQSFLYSSSISISDRSSLANSTAGKATVYNESPDAIPNAPVKKGTVVRARLVKNGYLPGEIVANTYFIMPSNSYSLPVINLSTSEINLFDYNEGIYTGGAEFQNLYPNGTTQDCKKGNYNFKGSAWEKAGNFEYFINGNQEISEPIKYRIHGGCSRSFPRKGIRVYSDGNFDYPFFEANQNLLSETILLRGGGQENKSSFIRDALFQDIVKELPVASMHSTPSILFINAEFWGFHNVRERVDEKYLEDRYDIDGDSIDMISFIGENVEEGTDADYLAVKNYVRNNSLQNTSNYDYIKTKIDIDNFIEYHILEIFSANSDWPSNNVKLWRSNVINSENEYEDGRWRWILYDVEAGMNFWGNKYENSFEKFSQYGGTEEYQIIFNALMANDEFKEQFLTRFMDLLNSALSPSNTINYVEKWRNIVNPVLQEHIDRWETPTSPTTWNAEVDNISDFFQDRPTHQKTHLASEFNKSNLKDLTVNVNDSQLGYVKVNTLKLISESPGVSTNTYPWVGEYFSTMDISLKAEEQTASKFLHWLLNGSIYSTNAEINITITNDISLEAVFEVQITSSNPFPVANELDNCGYEFTNWDELETSGSFPNNMAFVFMDEPDPSISANISDFTCGAYNLTSRTRINGLDQNGIEFINTGNSDGNPGYPGTQLGGALLALNTVGYESLSLSFLASTIESNNREYNLRLQYRVGDLQPFQDVVDGNNNPIEYTRNSTNNHEQVFEEVRLPAELLDKPYVQLFWRFYFTGVRNNNSGGSRDVIRLDDIIISSNKDYTGVFSTIETVDDYGKISTSQVLTNSADLHYEAGKSIILEPGFYAPNSSVFKAEIKTCN